MAGRNFGLKGSVFSPRTSCTMVARPKVWTTICVLGVSPASSYPSRPPTLSTESPRPSRPISQRQMSTMWMLLFPSSPLPVFQSQCQS